MVIHHPRRISARDPDQHPAAAPIAAPHPASRQDPEYPEPHLRRAPHHTEDHRHQTLQADLLTDLLRRVQVRQAALTEAVQALPIHQAVRPAAARTAADHTEVQLQPIHREVHSLQGVHTPRVLRRQVQAAPAAQVPEAAVHLQALQEVIANIN